MRDDSCVAVALSELYCAESLCERTDLVDLDKDGVGAAEFDTFFEVFDVGDEEVVADELTTVADEVGEDFPAVPVVFCHAVLDGVDGEFFNEFLEEFCLLFASEFGSVCALLPCVVVYAVVEEFAGCAVETDGYVLAGYVACFLNGLNDDVECVFCSVKCGSETAFVANCSAETAGFEHALEVVEYFCAHADAFVERCSADRTDHEFLEADGSVGVCAAVDDVHHRNGKNVCVATADVFVEGQVEVVGSCLCNSERYAEDGVCAEVALCVGAVKSEHGFVDGDLVESAHTYEGRCDRTVYISHCFEDAFAHVAALVAVAELKSFVDACGCARGNGCTTACARFKNYVYFYCGVAAGIEHLTSGDFLNFHNSFIIACYLVCVLFPAKLRKISVIETACAEIFAIVSLKAF